MANPPQRKPSPKFYKIMSILFFAISAILAWRAFRAHDKFLWTFAAITLLNGCMAALKAYVVRETG